MCYTILGKNIKNNYSSITALSTISRLHSLQKHDCNRYLRQTQHPLGLSQLSWDHIAEMPSYRLVQVHPWEEKATIAACTNQV